MDEKQKELLRKIPKIDELTAALKKRGVFEEISADVIKSACRHVAGQIRQSILEGRSDNRVPSVDRAAELVQEELGRVREFHLRPVINATGIILHTNLGRAPLCKEALDQLAVVGGGYSNLEFDLVQGKRGSRYEHVCKILRELTGAEDALVVNNNAAAVLVTLNSLAEKKEAVVSRGELIEIGGEFRLPEIMEKSGAILHEVGTTNKTHFSDYEAAINENTGLLLKVHTSNYRIVGFTGEVSLSELVSLGRNRGIPVVNDLGSGCFAELDRFGLKREPTVRDVLATGVDIVTFSGDKLLGGPQAGIIVGRRDLLQKIKRNPFNRALRIDKLTIAALEATLKLYLNPEKAVKRIRALRALTEPANLVEKRAKKLLRILKKAGNDSISIFLKKGYSMAGGGSLPAQKIPTVLIAVRSSLLSVNQIEACWRRLDIPVIARIYEDELLLDLRTIEEEDFDAIRKGLLEICR
ncbi:MAG: L-seryl-tRNA(Sec) selenium transferase [Syntrophales bacterium]